MLILVSKLYVGLEFQTKHAITVDDERQTDRQTERAKGGGQIINKVGYETEKKAALANSRITNQLYLE